MNHFRQLYMSSSIAKTMSYFTIEPPLIKLLAQQIWNKQIPLSPINESPLYNKTSTPHEILYFPSRPNSQHEPMKQLAYKIETRHKIEDIQTELYYPTSTEEGRIEQQVPRVGETGEAPMAAIQAIVEAVEGGMCIFSILR